MHLDELSVLNPTPRRVEGPCLLHEMIRLSSNQPAIEHLEGDTVSTFTYANFHAASDAVARRIATATHGDQHYFIVPVLLPQGPRLYAALAGILKAGGAFCPLDIDAPPERLNFIIEDISATLAVVSTELKGTVKFPDHVRIIVLDRLETEAAADPFNAPRPTLYPTDPAYVMYTSGSTGTPKGVIISHDAATQALLAHDDHIPEFSRFFQFAAPTFDVSVFEIFFPLSRGKTLISANRIATLDDLPGVLKKMTVDACELTPTVAAGLLQRRNSAPQLRLLLTIGEMLNLPTVTEFGSDSGKPSLLWAMYGPTEATIHCTIQPGFASSSPLGTIGIPLQTTSCFILDAEKPLDDDGQLNILPRGHTGELALGGFQLADGYLNRPEQTSKAFIESSFGRVYRTGDRATLNKDSVLECSGRLSDGQIKLRGQRIELGEIEHAMLRTSGCHTAVALVVNSCIVGFCTAENSVSERDIRSTCRIWLSRYMVPSEVLILRELPRLPSGKVDKSALQELLEHRDNSPEVGPSYSFHQDHRSRTIMDVASKCLEASVPPNQTLASLGVDSLRAIKLASMLRECDINISVAEILRSRTVSDLFDVREESQYFTSAQAGTHAALNANTKAITAGIPELELVKDDIAEILRCSSLQLSMLHLSLQDPEAYYNEAEFEVDSAITLSSLSQGLETLCSQNEVLRMGFVPFQDRVMSVLFRSPLPGTVNVYSTEAEHECSDQPVTWLRPLRIDLVAGAEPGAARMIFRLHHAIYDGWSMDALLHDLSALIGGRKVTTRPQFRTVVNYHHFMKNSEPDKAQRRFWADHFLGWSRQPFPTLIEQPSPGPKRGSVVQEMEISPLLAAEEARRQDYGLSSLFAAALALVWKGILGTDDLVLGMVTSGRTLPVRGIDEILGPCMTTLPMRVQFKTLETVQDLIRNILKLNRSIAEHSTLPLSEIRKEARLQIWESPYDVLFAFQESLYSGAMQNGPFRPKRHLDRLETKVLFEVEPRPSGFSLQVTYHTDVMNETIASQMLSQVVAVTRKMVSSTSASLGSAFNEHTSFSSEYNIQPLKAKKYPAYNLAVRFKESLQTNHHHTAIEHWSRSAYGLHYERLSYEDLNSRANQLARWLLTKGACQGTVIGIMMDKSPLLYISILGIMKAGCAYLPLLHSTPVARVQEVFRQALLRFCLVDRPTPAATELKDAVSWLQTSEVAFEHFSTEDLANMSNEHEPAYVIYTSGTTGIPKGVSISQRNITSNIEELQKHYPGFGDNQSKLLQACSQAFDVSVFEIFFTWLSGMCLCTGSNDTMLADLELFIRSAQITHLSLTPTVATLVRPENVPDVKFLVTAGEPLTRNVLNAWGDRLWQGYGPSETTNICTVKKMNKCFNIEHLGTTLPNTSAVVLHPESTDVLPVGWVGELCFGGEQIAVGYLNAPKVTSASFILHEKYGRLYRSGDLGRMLPDGSLVILGRYDNQIKLRGQRIETAEIDNLLSAHQRVRSTATLLLRSNVKHHAMHCLVSFYITDGKLHGEEIQAVTPDLDTHSSLMSLLSSRLPSYMVPTHLIPISRLPRTSSGKCDKSLLQKLYHELSESYFNSISCQRAHEVHETDWSPQELAIRACISTSLDVPEQDIGRWTSLIGAGLDSITAIRVASDLSRALEKTIPISLILSHPCVSLLSSHISTLQTGHRVFLPLVCRETVQGVSAQFDVQPGTSLRILPCTPLQEAMLARGRDAYYNRTLLRLHVSPRRMRAIWDEVSRRHDILRTCFITTPDHEIPIAQVVLDHWEIPWKEYEAEALSLVDAITQHLHSLPDPLDSKIPPFSLATITHRGITFLSFVCHHALYDGTAINLLWREIESLAHGQQLLSPVSYEPFLHEARQQPQDWQKFWKAYFLGSRHRHVFPPPRDGQRINQTVHTVVFEHRLDHVQRRLRFMKSGLLPLCQASWSFVLSALTGSSDVVFGNVVSGRNVDVPGIDRLIAPCFNTIPVRQVLDTDMQNSELLQSLHDLNRTLLTYQFTPLRKIAGIAGLRRVFDTLLLVQQPLQEMDNTVWTLEEDSGEMDVPLVCEVTPCPNMNSIVVKIYYDMGAVAADEVTAIANHFITSTARLLDSPSSLLNLSTSSELLVRRQVSALGPFHRKQRNEEGRPSSDWSFLELSIRKELLSMTQRPESTVHRSTSIFRLGLDSISAVSFAARLRALGHRLSTSDVLQHPTCESLARRALQNSIKQQDEPTAQEFDDLRKSVLFEMQRILPSILPSTRQVEEILPCSPLQCAMATSFVTNSDNYLNLVCFSLDQNMTPARVISAWDAVRRQHQMLRTAIVPVDSTRSPYAMVRYSPDSLELPIKELESLHEANINLSQLRLQSAKRMLETQHLPPWQVYMTSVSEPPQMYLVIHHALYDATSLQQIFSNLANALMARPLTSMPDVKEGLSEMLTISSNRATESERFWKGKAEQSVVNRFPVLTPLREAKGRQIASHTSETAFSFLSKRCQERDITVQAAIEATWTRVLAAYIGEDDVVFGVTLSTRLTEATRVTPLPCLTTLPVIARNQSSNEALLRSIASYDAERSSHYDCSLSDVQKWLGSAANPVFDTLITYQGSAANTDFSPPLSITQEIGSVEFPVALEIQPGRNDTLVFTLSFCTSHVPPEQAVLILRQFDATLSSLVDESHDSGLDWSNSEMKLFSIIPPELDTISTDIQGLHCFVERQAAINPDRPALEFSNSLSSPSKVWTYRQLDDMGDKVAQILLRLELCGNIVAVHSKKCPEAYFAILGILKAGFAFVALDPSMPSARKEFILHDSGACCLLATSGALINFHVQVPVHRIDEDSLCSITSTTENRVKRSLDKSSTCYCLYTSGTTGTPKGCEITHENAVQAMMAFQHLFQGRWDRNSRWLQFAALHFDVSILEQYWSWSVGIVLVVAPHEVILDDLAGTISQLGITHLDLTPSLARLLKPEDVPSLWNGVFITGGEQLKQEILDAWGPKGVIYNAYGPTEATIGVTTYPQVPQNGRPSNIGKQFINVGTYVLQPNTEDPVLRGCVGELCISGKLVGKGYINREDATRRGFPWLARFRERVYRTGDLVRLLWDGSFEFLGRADDQVKLRGQRLELGEIDHVIRGAVSGLKDLATVVVTQQSPDRSVLVCFLSDGKHQADELRPIRDNGGFGSRARAACRAKLPAYMVPTYFLMVPFIPLSTNNKAEHKTLRRVFEALSAAELLGFTSSSNQAMDKSSQGMMKKIILAVADFTGSPKADLPSTTSVFEIGVDSINVTLFASHLRKQGSLCTPATVLQNPILADLARALASSEPQMTTSLRVHEARRAVQVSSHKHFQTVQNILGVKEEDIEYIAPCTPLQEGMLSTTLTRVPKGLYFVSFDLRLLESAKTASLRDAWSRLVQRYAILRTSFIHTSDSCLQVATRLSDLDWVENATMADREKRRQGWISASDVCIRKPILFTHVVDGGHAKLCVDIFHGIYDGTSMQHLLQELYEAYNGATSSLHAPSFIEAAVHGPLWRFDSSKKFWQDHLRGWQSSPMPRKASITNEDKAKLVSATTVLQGGSVKEALRRYNSTSQSLLLALWVSSLHQLHSVAPTVGVVIGGRALDLEGVEGTVGPMFNTLPFYAGSCNKPTWGELLDHCGRYSSSILNFQHVPLRSIQKWCSSGQPLFHNLFTVQRELLSSVSSDRPWVVEESQAVADYPLACDALLQENGDVKLNVVADCHFATRGDLESLLAHVERSLEVILKDSHITWHGGRQSDNSQSQVPPQPDEIPDPMNSDSFSWTAEAKTIRLALATLAECEVQCVGPRTTIQELGLDSIDVLRLSSMLRDKRIKMSPSAIMRCESIEEMLATSYQDDHAYDDPTEDLGNRYSQSGLKECVSAVGKDLSTIESYLPATPVQEGMVLAMLQSDFSQYFTHDALRVNCEVDLDQLSTACNRVVEANPILRTGFAEVSHESLDLAYCQIVHRYKPLEMTCQPLDTESDLPTIFELAKDRAKQAGAWEDLLQIRLASCRSHKYIIISISHALYDGWSLGLFYHDLMEALDVNKQPKSRPSPEAYLLRHGGRHKDKADQFWRGFLRNARPTLLSSDSGCTEALPLPHRGAAISAVKANDITYFCKSGGFSLQSLLFAAWAVVLSHRTRQLDVSFGIVLAGRDFEGAEELMFPTMNTVPQRCILAGTCSSFLLYLEDVLRQIRAWQSFPLRKAMRAATGRSILFDSIFMVQKSPVMQNTSQDILESVLGDSQTEYPVSGEAELLDDGLVWRITSTTSQYTDAELSELLADLDHALEHLMHNPSQDLVEMCVDQVSICGLPPCTLHELEDNDVANTSLTDEKVSSEWSAQTLAIAEVLSTVSHIPLDEIRLWNSIYHLGLDSISAIKTSKLLVHKGISLRPRDLLLSRDILHMASIAVDRGGEAFESLPTTPPADAPWTFSAGTDLSHLLSDRAIPTDDVEMILPALPMQVYMLRAWYTSHGNLFFPEFRVRLPAGVQPSHVTDAWQALQHEVPLLRTTFIFTGSEDVPILQILWKELPTSFANGWATCYIEDDESGGHLLVLKIHHALYDAFSLSPVMRRLLHLCTSPEALQEPVPLDGWIRYTTASMSPESIASKRQFWQEYLRNMTSHQLEIPGVDKSDDWSRVMHVRTGAICDMAAIRRSAATSGTSVQALFLATYAKAIVTTNPEYLVDRHVVLGVYFANRGDDGNLPSYFPTLCIVPIKVKVDVGKGLLSAALDVQRDLNLMSSMGVADVGLWHIKDWTGVQIDTVVNFIAKDADVSAQPELDWHTSLDNEKQRPDVVSPASFGDWSHESLAEAYCETVEVEASLDEKGLTVGIFGPQTRLTDQGAADLVDRITATLLEGLPQANV